MPNLSQLVLPVKDVTTGEITNQTFDLDGGGGGGGSFITLEQEVTLSTDSEIQCTFSNSAIKTNSAIQAFIDSEDIYYKTMDISDGLVVITFTPQKSSRIINVRIYIM